MSTLDNLGGHKWVY